MKRIAAVISVTLFILAGVYLYFTEMLAPRDIPEEFIVAENAITSAGTIAIASIDMEYVRRIDQYLSGEDDPSPLLMPQAGDSVFDDLIRNGINLIKKTDYALAAINIGEGSPKNIIVLLGDYPVEEIKQVLRNRYIVDENKNDFWMVQNRLAQNDNEDPCRTPGTKNNLKPDIKAVYLQKNRIIISTPEFMPVVLKRFSEFTASAIKLEKWRKFRHGKVVAGALISPKDARKGATDLITSTIFTGVSKQPLDTVLAGATVSLLPPQGLDIIINAHSSDSDWPLNIKEKYDSWVVSAVNELKGMPTLASLIRIMSVKADGKVLRVQTSADETTIANLKKLPTEFMGMLFSGVGVSSENADSVKAEKILPAEEIHQFKPHYSLSSIPTFDNKSTLNKPDTVTGPFAIYLKSIEILPTDDSVIQLTVKAEGKGFENIPSESMHISKTTQPASLKITSVDDDQGDNLLREEKCGKARNIASQSLNVAPDKVFENNKWVTKAIKITGEKSIRLKKDIDITQIHSIKGKISLDIATRTATKTIIAPLAGKMIETDQVRIFFKASGASTLRYDLSGKMHYILAVHAKNGQGQYLDNSGSSAIGGNGRSTVTKVIKGKIASIEIVYAEKMESKDFVFEINKVAPKYGEPKSTPQWRVKTNTKNSFKNTYRSNQFDKVCPNKQKVNLGAFTVCLSKFSERWGRDIGGEFEVYAPAANGLQKNLAAAELSIDTLVVDGGKTIPFNKSARLDMSYSYDSKYNKATNGWTKTNKKLHAGYVTIYSDKKVHKEAKASAITGSLKIRLPRKLQTFTLDANGLGEEIKSQSGIRAKISRYEDWNTYLELQGNIEKIVQILPRSKDGTILSTGNDRITEKTYQTWGLSKEEKAIINAKPKTWEGMITIYGKPKTIDIVYATKFDILAYPYEFTVKY